jgi:hypothetical protein
MALTLNDMLDEIDAGHAKKSEVKPRVSSVNPEAIAKVKENLKRGGGGINPPESIAEIYAQVDAIDAQLDRTESRTEPAPPLEPGDPGDDGTIAFEPEPKPRQKATVSEKLETLDVSLDLIKQLQSLAESRGFDIEVRFIRRAF